MSTLDLEHDPVASKVELTSEHLVVDLADGRRLIVPLRWYPRLHHGADAERRNWQLLGDGYAIEWPDLDEHIAIEGLLAGRRSGESPASLNRWFAARLSLRALLLLVAAFCVWMAYHSHWIRARREARQWIQEHEIADQWSAAAADEVSFHDVLRGRRISSFASERAPRMPWKLTVLGAKPIYHIHLDNNRLVVEDAARIESLQSLFPEAEGVYIHGDGWRSSWPPDNMESFINEADPARPGKAKRKGS